MPQRSKWDVGHSKRPAAHPVDDCEIVVVKQINGPDLRCEMYDEAARMCH